MPQRDLTPYRAGGLLAGRNPFLSLHREMNRLFDDAFRGLPAMGEGRGEMGSFINADMNVSETEKDVRVSVELPGVSEQDIDVNLEDDVLTIRGEKRFEESKGGEKENYHFVERSYGTFQRSIRLPFAVDPEQVKASFENGVLTVTLPKTPQQERTRKIQIQGRQGGAGGPSEKPASGSQGRGSSQGKGSAQGGS